MNDRLAKMYMDLAESWIKKGDRDQASACLEKVLKLNPAGLAAASAQAKLTQLGVKTPGVPAVLQRP